MSGLSPVPFLEGDSMTWLQAAILAVTALAGSIHTLVLTNGDRLAVRDDVRIEEGLVIFRSATGSLYSIPLSEIDVDRTEELNDGPPVPTTPSGPVRSNDQARLDLERMLADRSLSGRQIVVSEEEKNRLIEEAARSRGVPVDPAPIAPVSGPTPSTGATQDDDGRGEWYWRERSRTYQENVRRAREELQLLLDKERRLQDEILGLLSLGYNGNQFSLQVLQLAHTRDSIPRAQLNLERAERQLAQFKEDARRQGILPGWLR
jgi:hypothetical protein